MKLRILGLAAVLMLTPSLAFAALDTKTIGQEYIDKGYTRVEVKVGVTQAKVEAIKGTTKLEVIYDIASGTILKSETETVRAGENTTPGVFVRSDDDDFLDDRRSDDNGGDRHGGDDDSDDDSSHSGRDDDGGRHGRDDDGDDNDDHGGRGRH